ncbi:probable protein phosphatase 2C 75 isoform X2 [Hibiscus syriacus]|uniref:probable protein phosphatase 2C 75 isoform X2 n=1 Tax=Hibiscus syriacus TaxID=106335 RepID=UPI001925034F|nr:probable protein phosphatase 2C 75 isoform X2 [Hibiscus syriacus]
MTEVCSRMWSDEDDDTSVKCRKRRRRRIELRRHAAISASGAGALRSPGQTEGSGESSDYVREGKRMRMLEVAGDMVVANGTHTSSGEEESTAVKTIADFSNGPVYGTMSISGRSREMEDAIFVRTELCRPDVNLRRPVHFFAVYDGHGGSHVAAMCREKMHVLVEEELMRVNCNGESDRGKDSRSVEESWRSAMKRSFERMDVMATSTCACGSVGHRCGCHSMEVALGGSTAVIALLTPDHIVVANCGDSRAVLYRGGKAIPLSFDHKPDRPDELARIEAAGGRVIFVNGARVEGILAMSRAIGKMDYYYIS